jgi:hypothetical protein
MILTSCCSERKTLSRIERRSTREAGAVEVPMAPQVQRIPKYDIQVGWHFAWRANPEEKA